MLAAGSVPNTVRPMHNTASIYSSPGGAAQGQLRHTCRQRSTAATARKQPTQTTPMATAVVQCPGMTCSTRSAHLACVLANYLTLWLAGSKSRVEHMSLEDTQKLISRQRTTHNQSAQTPRRADPLQRLLRGRTLPYHSDQWPKRAPNPNLGSK